MKRYRIEFKEKYLFGKYAGNMNKFYDYLLAHNKEEAEELANVKLLICEDRQCQILNVEEVG